MQSSSCNSGWEGHNQHREQQGGGPEVGLGGHSGQWSAMVTVWGPGQSGLGGERTLRQRPQATLNPAESPGVCPGGI